MKTILTTLLLLLASSTLSAQPDNPYTVPEYEPTKAVLIEWDFNNSTWSLYSELIAACRLATEVILVVRNSQEEAEMTQRLIADGVPMSQISFVHVPCERMWIRDHGPFAVKTSEGVAYLDFNDKADSGFDENLPTNLANLAGLPAFQRPWIFDGGNLLVDRNRTLFCTDALFTNNPGMDPEVIRQELSTFMGIEQIVTLRRQHDDYWAHIDMQAKLLNDTCFVLSSLPSSAGPNYDTLEYNYNILAALTAPNGQPYLIERLPMADNWKTYANALILNNLVLVPTYDHPYDDIALDVYGSLMPGYTITGINCNKIISWEGAVHCITMQLFDENQVSSVKALSARSTGVTLWPNPSTRGISPEIAFDLGETGETRVEVYQADGTLLWSQTQRLEAGPQRLSLPGNLGAGIYIVALLHEGKVATTRWTVSN